MRRPARTVSFTLVLLALAVPAAADRLTRVSVGNTGEQGVANSGSIVHGYLSADGRYVVFNSSAANLVAGDTNGTYDTFLRDLVAGTTTRLTVTPGGVEANGYSHAGVPSPDVRFVGMSIVATNLVTPDANGTMQDVVVLDRATGTFERANVADDGTQANGQSHGGSVSADGRYVLVESDATNLVPGDTNGVRDIFVRDRVAGTITRVSVSTTGVQANDTSSTPTMSADGRIVVWNSDATNLVPGDTNGKDDIFVRDLDTGITSRVSVRTDGSQSESISSWGIVSGDGRRVLFAHAGALAENDRDGNFDVYLRDLVAGTTTLVSADKNPATPIGVALLGAISHDGRYVAFYSSDIDLAGDIEPDTNGKTDAFWKDMVTGRVLKMSRPPGGGQGNDNSGVSSRISPDGRRVLISSPATNLVAGDTNGCTDLFLWEHTCGDGLVDDGETCDDGNDESGDGCDENCTVTACGNTIVTAGEECDDGNAVTGDGCKPDCRSDSCGDGLPGLGEECDDGNDVNGDACDVNCTTPRCGNGAVDPGEDCDDGNALVCDGCDPDCTTAPVGAINTTRESVATGGAQVTGGSYGSNYPAISADGRFIAFASDAINLVANDTNGFQDVFVRDRVAGTTVRLAGPSGIQGNNGTALADMSADCRFVSLMSAATNLVAGDTNKRNDIFRFDTTTGALQRVSVANDGSQGDGDSYSGEISDDGRFVVFDSLSTNLVPNDTNGVRDIFVRDVVAGTTERVSVSSGGQPSNGVSHAATISSDGRIVVFPSQATNLVGGDTNGVTDVFAHDRVTHTTVRVSLAADGSQGLQRSDVAAVSGDGRFVVFSSAAKLASTDINGNFDIYVRDLTTNTTEHVSYAPGADINQGVAVGADISVDGRFVAWNGFGDLRYAGYSGEADRNGKGDVFLRDRMTGETLRVSGPPGGCAANGESYVSAGSITPDGHFVGFISRATSLVAGDTNGRMDVFLYERLCGNGVVDGSEACDDGNQANGDGCDANCTATACGNGVVSAGELCDDGNGVSGDGCNPDCSFDGCGNGSLDGGEACDDGNQADGDGCDTNCTATGCGNGIVTAGESCDDGNGEDGDGCTQDCRGLDCSGGWGVTNAKLTLKNLGGLGNDEGLVLKGNLDVPAGVDFQPAATGLQLLVREAGSNGRTLFDLTNDTFVIPPSTFNGCDRADGWRLSNGGPRQSYTNVSKCLGPPACTPGSANGLKSIKFSDKRAYGRGIDFTVTTKGSSIPTPGTTIVATLVLGTQPADATLGTCADQSFGTASCKVTRLGATLACK